MTGPELKARRKELELTMQDVADRVGCLLMQRTWPEWWPFLTKQTNELPEV